MTENTTTTPDAHDAPATPKCSKCANMLKSLAGKPLYIRIITWYLAACALFWVLGWVFRGDPGYTVTVVLARPVSLLLVAAAVVLTVMAGFLSIVERLRWKVVFAYIGACLAAWIWAIIFGNPHPGTFAMKAVAGPLAALLLAAAAFTVLGHVLRALGIDKSAGSTALQEQAQS